MLCTAYNSRHTATLRSAQIRQSRTSYVRKTLSEIPEASEKNLENRKLGGENG